MLISKFHLWFVQIIDFFTSRWEFLLLNMQHRQLVTLRINSLQIISNGRRPEMVTDYRHRRLLLTFAILHVLTVIIYSLWSLKLRTLVIHSRNSIVKFYCLNLLLNCQVILNLRSDILTLFHDVLILPLRRHRARFRNGSHFWRIPVCYSWVWTCVTWREIVDGDVLIYDLAWIVVVLSSDEVVIVAAVAAEGSSPLGSRIWCELQRQIIVLRSDVFERTFSFDSLNSLLGAWWYAPGTQWSTQILGHRLNFVLA